MGQRDVASDTKPGFKVNEHTHTRTQTQGTEPEESTLPHACGDLESLET